MPTLTPAKGGPRELQEKELDRIAGGMIVINVNNNQVDGYIIDYSNIPDGTVAVFVHNKERHYREGQLPTSAGKKK
jgi:hypothetical protein